MSGFLICTFGAMAFVLVVLAITSYFETNDWERRWMNDDN